MNDFGTAIILAGGKSSRMGFDKQFLKIDEKRLMEMVISELRKIFDEIIIITNKPEEYDGLHERITTDIIKDMGPLGGIHAGLMGSKSQYVFVIPCDMPNMDLKYINYMKKVIEDKQVEVCISLNDGNIEPLHGFYSKDIIDEIEKYLQGNRRSIVGLLKGLNVHYIDEKEFDFNPNIFVNLNTPEELRDYCELRSLKKHGLY